MPQIFHPSFNTIAKASVFGGVLLLGGSAWVLMIIVRSPYVTQANVVKAQPIPFSHAHHVEGLGLDCRYCHMSVEESAFAGIPDSSLCMHCHSQIWADSPMLEPVRNSVASGRPVKWTRVHDLPDFVYFDHSIHVAKGVACVTCHGRVDQMPLMWREHALHMEWCLACHRKPQESIVSIDAVFDVDADPSRNRNGAIVDSLMNPVRTDQLTDCSICHR